MDTCALQDLARSGTARFALDETYIGLFQQATLPVLKFGICEPVPDATGVTENVLFVNSIIICLCTSKILIPESWTKQKCVQLRKVHFSKCLRPRPASIRNFALPSEQPKASHTGDVLSHYLIAALSGESASILEWKLFRGATLRTY